MKSTIDLILGRFKGLEIERTIPCICHWKKEGTTRCKGKYKYDELVRRMEKGKTTIECPESFEEVSVPELLYGIHASTDRQVMQNIENMVRETREKVDDFGVLKEMIQQQSELLTRNFTRQWNLEQKKIDSECPGTFCLVTGNRGKFNPKNWISDEYLMHLICQHPSGPHTVGAGYALRRPEEWWVEMYPWLKHVIEFVRYGVPFAKGVVGAVYNGETEKKIPKADVLESITKELSKSESDVMRKMKAETEPDQGQRAMGSALRALQSFLKEADPQQKWGGLNKTITPDGNILWLCDRHREPYIAKPLVL